MNMIHKNGGNGKRRRAVSGEEEGGERGGGGKFHADTSGLGGLSVILRKYT